MPIGSVPWAVGGAQHDVDLARQVAYNAADGNEGVVGSTACQVTALAVPGTAVQILPGAFNVLNRTPGYTTQMYMDTFTGETTVDVASTGSGAKRSDLVVAEIMDPNLSGSPYQPPDDLASGPYARARIISGVAATTETVVELGQGLNAIPLARIDIPASTGTITQTMIKDLRTVVRPQRWRELRSYDLVSGDEEEFTAQSTEGEYWPDLARWDIRIPEWATHAMVIGRWDAARFPQAQQLGRLWVGIGDPAQTTPNQARSQEVQFDSLTGGGITRASLVAAGTIAIPASMRGRLRRFGLRGYRVAPLNTGRVTVDSLSAVTLDVEFAQNPVTGQIGV